MPPAVFACCCTAIGCPRGQAAALLPWRRTQGECEIDFHDWQTKKLPLQLACAQRIFADGRAECNSDVYKSFRAQEGYEIPSHSLY